MARLTVFSNSEGNDVGDFDWGLLYFAQEVGYTPTLYQAIFEDGIYIEFRGDDFRINEFGEPTAGTVRQFKAYADGTSITMAGFRVDATEIRDVARTYSTSDDMDLIRSIFSGDDSFRGDEGEDRLLGFDGDDKIRGGSKSDRLFGNDGDDAVWGNKGKDRLYGNDGDDKLIGGAGADFLLGGDGADVFRFNAGLNARNIDKIDDFIAWEDSIELDRRVFDEAGGIGTLERRAFAIGTEARDASDRIIYDDEAGALYYDADGTGAAEQVQFARLGTGLDLTADHFQIIA